eukprot:CAMPEP_0171896458 /NCGR_PEP_ID=MMETSP0992-20121227/47585_1 /TAXON_ID=483369 /ORGANISM="non described non described, Strain CCMP2098" /LENGTH=227 /DNA_ID=CAMNT_0012524465 /DNA_START=182 /DNA_END=861 /DNA_ORIENTATION=-
MQRTGVLVERQGGHKPAVGAGSKLAAPALSGDAPEQPPAATAATPTASDPLTGSFPLLQPSGNPSPPSRAGPWASRYEAFPLLPPPFSLKDLDSSSKRAGRDDEGGEEAGAFSTNVTARAHRFKLRRSRAKSNNTLSPARNTHSSEGVGCTTCSSSNRKKRLAAAAAAVVAVVVLGAVPFPSSSSSPSAWSGSGGGGRGASAFPFNVFDTVKFRRWPSTFRPPLLPP